MAGGEAEGAEDASQAVARVTPSVVSITTNRLRLTSGRNGSTRPTRARSLGSGFLLDEAGHILTCNHVIAGYQQIVVQLADGTEFDSDDVRVVGRDPVTDLAVVRVRRGGVLTPVEFGDSDSLVVGQPVVAVGSPFGLEGTATGGIISALDRWGLARSAGPDFQQLIQTDALVNPGNSGGPLVDLAGRVVGVSSFTKTHLGQEFTGIGFAIPANQAIDVATQLIRFGRVIRGYLGVNTQPLTSQLRMALGLEVDGGALVAWVVPDGPGARAGLNPGDVVLEIDYEPVGDERWLQERLAGAPPRDTIRLGLWRRGERIEVLAILGSWPTAGVDTGRPPATENWLGLLVRDITHADMVRTGASSGVVIEAVEPGGPAEEANLRAGDVVIGVNFASVDDKAAYDRIAAAMMGYSRPALFHLVRHRTAFYQALGP